MSTKKLQIIGNLGNKVYVQNEEPVDATDGALWLDLDEEEINGSNIVFAPEVAEVGQILVVKSVDENGRPITWESVDIPNSTYRHIKSIVLEEEVSSLTIDTDENGNPFALKQILVILTVIGGAGNTEVTPYNFYINDVKAAALTQTVNNGIYKAGASVKSALECLYIGPGHYLYTYANNSIPYRQHYSYGRTESITSFNIYAKTSGITFGVGTQITVLGVDV